MSDDLKRNLLILPSGKLSKRNQMLKKFAFKSSANGWEIQFVGGEGEPYRGAELTEPVYFDECPDAIEE